MKRTTLFPALFALPLLLVLAACEEKVRGIDWWQSHPTERAAKIAECQNNPGEAMTLPNCINAFSGEQAAREAERVAQRATEEAEKQKAIDYYTAHPEELAAALAECPDEFFPRGRCAGVRQLQQQIEAEQRRLEREARQEQFRREAEAREEERRKREEEQKKAIAWFKAHPRERAAKLVECTKRQLEECSYARQAEREAKQEAREQAIEGYKADPQELAAKLEACAKKGYLDGCSEAREAKQLLEREAIEKEKAQPKPWQ